MNEEQEIERVKDVLRTLIAWIAQSSVGVISVAEAEELIERLSKK